MNLEERFEYQPHIAHIGKNCKIAMRTAQIESVYCFRTRQLRVVW